MTHNSSSKGQGLLETVIALGIIITGLVAILGLVIMGISFSGRTKERVIAVNLAREGIEILRAIRDSNQLDPMQNWPFGLNDGNWIVDFNNTTDLSQSADNSDINLCTNCQLYLDEEDRYSHTVSLTTTVFKRLVKIIDKGANEKTIISRVSWKERNQFQEIVLENVLTDWR